MAMPSGAQLQQLRLFVEGLKKNPDWLHHPDFDFLSDYLVDELGCKLPPPFKAGRGSRPASESTNANTKTNGTASMKDDSDDDFSEVESEDSMESDFEEVKIDGVIEADDVNAQSLTMGDTTSSSELSESEEEAFSAKRSEGMSALSDGRLDDAVKLFSEAIDINAHSAVVFAKRGVALIKLNRPCAGIRDCSRALELNPDSALAYKWRGRAQRLRGNVLASAIDLRTACKIDFDEQTDEWLKEVDPLAAKIEEHNRTMERKREEKKDRERKERLRKAREANAKAAKDASSTGCGAGMPGGKGGMGDLGDLLGDPDLMSALSDPEMSKAFADVSQNPANISKYQNNPKVMSFIMKMMTKMGGGEAGGAGLGGMPGMPSAFASTNAQGKGAEAASANTTKPPSATDDLD